MPLTLNVDDSMTQTQDAVRADQELKVNWDHVRLVVVVHKGTLSRGEVKFTND